MERNLKLTLRYDGTFFHGWQSQPNGATVESEIKKACFKILGENVKLQSCSRTDAGVHANMFCCNFRTNTERDNKKIISGLNAVLPESIAIYGCEDMDFDFHARYSCIGKEYIYKIWNQSQRNPFYNNYAYHYPYKLDDALLNSQAKSFIGTHDFTSFCASGSTVISNVRTIYDCGVKRDGDIVTFFVRGNGFLYNMVRIMVGTLIDMSRGKIEIDSLDEIIEAKNRAFAGITAKPQGLYLNKVFYDETELTYE